MNRLEGTWIKMKVWLKYCSYRNEQGELWKVENCNITEAKWKVGRRGWCEKEMEGVFWGLCNIDRKKASYTE